MTDIANPTIYPPTTAVIGGVVSITLPALPLNPSFLLVSLKGQRVGVESETVTMSDAFVGTRLADLLADTVTMTDAFIGQNLNDNPHEIVTLTDTWDGWKTADVLADTVTLTDEMVAQIVLCMRRVRLSLNITTQHVSLKFQNDSGDNLSLDKVRIVGNPITGQSWAIPLNVTDKHASIKFENVSGAALTLDKIRLLFNNIAERNVNIPMNINAHHVAVKFQSSDTLKYVSYKIDRLDAR